jgi:hypothetical protein
MVRDRRADESDRSRDGGEFVVGGGANEGYRDRRLLDESYQTEQYMIRISERTSKMRLDQMDLRRDGGFLRENRKI